MTFKTILAPMMIEAKAETALRSAINVARACHGHVMAAHLRQKHAYYPPVVYYPMASDVTALALEKHAEAASQFARDMRALFERVCDDEDAHVVPISEALKRNGVTASWTDGYGALPASLGRAARIADVSLAAIPGGSAERLEIDLFESLLMDSGRPVLLATEDGFAGLAKRPLIAWDGSQQSARAASAALPIFSETAEAMVLTLGECDPDCPNADDAAQFLDRHGIRASGVTLDDGGMVAEGLMEQAAAHEADLIVLGGYSHSRVHEALLGGVTKQMVKHGDRAMLMTH